MKKTLVALAALAATGVFAQSSLTVFGTADAGLAIGNGDVANVIGLRNSGLASSASSQAWSSLSFGWAMRALRAVSGGIEKTS